MTSARRFDQDLPTLLEELYGTGLPDYRDDIVRQTRRVRQRPAWTFPERWLPMDLVTERKAIPGIPWRMLATAALLIVLLAATLLVYVGSRPRLAPPFGPATNGAIAYTDHGEIVVRDGFHGRPRILIGGDGEDSQPWYSPDGSRLAFVRTIDGREYLMIANADGSEVRRIFSDPLIGSWGDWHPDGRTMALVNEVRGVPRLYLVQTDGSGSREVELGRIRPSELAWRPPTGEELLVRGLKPDGHLDLFLVRTDGSAPRPLGLPSDLQFGIEWDLGGPDFSPDGRRIAVNSVIWDDTAKFAHFRILVVDLATNDRRILPGPSASVQENWPLWTPDGQSLVVLHFVFDGDASLAIMPADGSARARTIGPTFPAVADGTGDGLIKVISPDGTKVLAHHDDLGRMYSIDLETGQWVDAPWAPTDLPDWQRQG